VTTDHMSTLETPAGPFTILVADDGAVLASGWTATLDDLLLRIAAPLRPSSVRVRSDLGPVTAAARAYHDGDFSAIDAIEVHQSSGEFIQRAWHLLRAVPPGKPLSYTDFAALAGRPDAIRAAAAACARNAAALFVPCHRVLRSDGTLGGYRWGLDIKRWLLVHESVKVS
jgi:methylated-DNA-[protein]-cysteine S-methyltransferase